MSRQAILPAGVTQLAPRAAVTAAAGTFTVKDVVAILRQRVWLIVIVTAATIAAAMALFLFLRRYYPEYRSMGFVECKMPMLPDVLGRETLIPQKDIIALETNSKAAYLMNDTFLRNVLGRTAVQGTRWYQKNKDDNVRLLDQFKDNFQATPRRDSAYVIVSMDAGDRDEAMLILNEALDQFYTDMNEGATRELRSNLSSLNSEKDTLERELLAKRQQQAELARGANVPPAWQQGGAQGRTVVTDELGRLHQEKLRLETLLKELEISKATVEAERAQGAYSSQVQMAAEQDPIVMGLKQQMATYITARDRLMDRLGEEHREVKEMQSIIQSMEGQLAQRQGQLQQQYALQEGRGIETSMKSTQEELDAVNAKLEVVSVRQLDLDQKMLDYTNLQTDIDLLTLRLQEYQKAINETNSKMRAMGVVNVLLVKPMMPPLKRSSPRWQVFLPGGMVLGLMLSLGLAFLLEFLDDSIKSPSDVVRHLNLPLLGMVPAYDEEGAEEEAAAKISATHPQAMISESYRQVRTNLFFAAPAGELKSLLITSSSADCGKTTTAVNLGITLANEGRRVLLVDGNFRRAALNRLFSADGPNRGLSNVLVGQATAADVIRPSGIAGLDLMDSGPAPPSPADLLSNQRMRDFLERQKEYYDHIIIDGPAALVVADARVLAAVVDGTIVVVHAGNTSRGIVQRLIRELKTGHIRIVGILLNAVQPRRGGYFQKAYRSYYDYISEEPAKTLAGGVDQGGAEKPGGGRA